MMGRLTTDLAAAKARVDELRLHLLAECTTLLSEQQEGPHPSEDEETDSEDQGEGPLPSTCVALLTP